MLAEVALRAEWLVHRRVEASLFGAAGAVLCCSAVQGDGDACAACVAARDVKQSMRRGGGSVTQVLHFMLHEADSTPDGLMCICRHKSAGAPARIQGCKDHACWSVQRPDTHRSRL
jgi:hypothetical protein